MRQRPRFPKIDRTTLAQVTGGGANIGGILQAASPLLGMIPGIGPIASAIMPMIGQMTSGAGGGQQQAAQAQPGAAPQPSSGDPSQAIAPQSSPRHHGGGGPSVSVSVSNG